MSGFRKAKAEQAALKMAVYGPPGSGKTFTALLIAEGLSKLTGKRVALVDTEHGSDFYCKAVAKRSVHPEAFDFDALYTKSITETLKAVTSINQAEHGIVVLDSMTHLWEACIAAYSGPKTSIGGIPMHAWGRIKKPYKDLMAFMLSSHLHVIICGRQGTEYATDEETDQLKAVGLKMKAEGETPYEPHILLRMESVRGRHNEQAAIMAYVEKDRTGTIQGRSFVNPTFSAICTPLLGLLGDKQASVPTTDETASRDAEQIAHDEAARTKRSLELLNEWRAKIMLATSGAALKAIGKKITPQLKAQMLTADVATLREVYQDREREVVKTAYAEEDLPEPPTEPEANGTVHQPELITEETALEIRKQANATLGKFWLKEMLELVHEHTGRKMLEQVTQDQAEDLLNVLRGAPELAIHNGTP